MCHNKERQKQACVCAAANLSFILPFEWRDWDIVQPSGSSPAWSAPADTQREAHLAGCTAQHSDVGHSCFQSMKLTSVLRDTTTPSAGAQPNSIIAGQVCAMSLLCVSKSGEQGQHNRACTGAARNAFLLQVEALRARILGLAQGQKGSL